MKYQLALTLLLCISNIAYAAGDIRPANFDVADREKQVTERFKWPQEAKGNIELTLSCFSIVKANGRLDRTGCFTKNNFEGAFNFALAKAAKGARANPALIGGEYRDVYVQYRVTFKSDALKVARVAKEDEDGEEKSKRTIRKEEKKALEDAIAKANRSIVLYLNPGYEENVNAYGIDHIAGQRAIGKKEPWSDACPKRAKFTVLVLAYLSETGQAESPTVQHANGVLPTATCQNAIMDTILASAYTPAIADGVPVPSSFVELFGN